jgi:hypothetical protein
MSPHTLRQPFGRTLVDGGVDVTTVADLGHADISTTAIYTAPKGRAPRRRRAAARRRLLTSRPALPPSG